MSSCFYIAVPQTLLRSSLQLQRDKKKRLWVVCLFHHLFDSAKHKQIRRCTRHVDYKIDRNLALRLKRSIFPHLTQRFSCSRRLLWHRAGLNVLVTAVCVKLLPACHVSSKLPVLLCCLMPLVQSIFPKNFLFLFFFYPKLQWNKLDIVRITKYHRTINIVGQVYKYESTSIKRKCTSVASHR